MIKTACEGLQVVELGAGSIAGSLAGMLLADNGARVVKVEPPEGDRLRTAHPSGFLVWNRGKESLVADLRTDDGRRLARELILAADVVIEAFGAGVADTWGIGYDDVREANPGLVWCSVKGFGSTGAYAELPAYEGVVATKMGYWNMGAFGIRPGPIFNSGFMASNGAGHLAVGGILAALLVRERTGRGQQVEATLANGINPYDYFGTMTWQFAQRMAAQAAAAGGAPAGGSHGMSAGSRVSFLCPTGDGRWINFTHMLPNQAQALTRALGLGHLLDDPQYASMPLFATADLAQDWETKVWEALRTKSYAEWEPILLADPNIAFEVARTCEEGLDHPQILHNGERIVIDDPDHGPIEEVGPVAKFTATPAVVERSAPRLGEHGGPFERRVVEPSGGPAPAHPLEGVTIIELGYFYAMPYGLSLAADLGARVIKLEGFNGDPMRTAFGVPEVPAVKTTSGKESLAVDLTTPEGQEMVLRLVEQADVFVNGFRPGVAERLGLGEETIVARNPSILFVHATGYGSDGPYAHRPIYAGCASAIAGQIYRHAAHWLDPELTTALSTEEAQVIVLPRLRGPNDGDANACVAVFSTLLLGLFARQRTGVGQRAYTSMIGANALAYADDFNRYRDKPPTPLPDADNNGVNAVYRVYPAAEGFVFLAAPRQKEVEALLHAIDRSDLLDDERFATPEARAVADDAFADVLAAVFATRSAQEWESALVPKGVACVAAATVGNSEFVATDPVFRETGLSIEVDHPLFGRIVRSGLAVAMSETPGEARPSCLPGEHTRSILAELGFDEAAIADLCARNVVMARD